jgi:hypothetical protein
MTYKVTIALDPMLNGIITAIDDSGREWSFIAGSGNRFDIEYQAWLAEGNQPEIVNIDEPSTPTPATIEERLEAAELMIDLLLTDTQEAV